MLNTHVQNIKKPGENTNNNIRKKAVREFNNLAPERIRYKAITNAWSISAEMTITTKFSVNSHN